jgi:endonuclease/exonuclease/phosphatase family metal-dependent hydrolase
MIRLSQPAGRATARLGRAAWSVAVAGSLLGLATAAAQQATPGQQPTPPKQPAPATPAKQATPPKQATPAKQADSAKPAQGTQPSEPKGKAKREAGFWYGQEKAPAKKPGAIRIAAYNIENVFDDKDDPSLQGEYDDIKMVTKPTRLAAIADAIKRLDADMISIEEVESLDTLKWFRDTYLKGLGYDHAYSEDVGYYRGVEQGFLSRYPIVEHRTWVSEDLSDMAGKRTGEGWSKPKTGPQEAKFQRSPLLVTVDVNGEPITLISVHKKAGGNDFAYHRESEALQTLEFVKEILAKNPDARVAVMGDFNATPGQKPVKVYSEGGMQSAYDFRAVKKGNTKDLYTTHDSGRAIDFIFMTPALAKCAVDGSFFVLSTVHPASDYDWRKDPNKDGVPPGYGSDHYPVAVDIALPAKKP